ncbi:MAG: 3-deoxy-8-phosphooctulonate synthase [Planctomycetaceae bacterium]|nr:3-deoxy-8-phosphooctulonate synthase [Planctomycetaceae bacterium]
MSDEPHAPKDRLHAWWDAGPIVPGRPLLVIAGPCVLESDDVNRGIAERMKRACDDAGAMLVFKASFDKANRSSIRSDRGPGLEGGLRQLETIGREFDVPLLTDVHEAAQAMPASEVVDILQVPAFLCRQTDLLVACGTTGAAVSVKKGQFLAPNEMRNVLEKLSESGCRRMMATERGTFFGYHRLVTDFIGLGDLREIAAEFGAPVCFDATHSTQLPGGEGEMSGGRPDRGPLLARAAVAAGISALFLETHLDPASARSDRATVMPIDVATDLIGTLVRIREAIDA